MFISDFAIQRPIVTIVAMIALVVFGLVALVRLQTDEFPDIDAPIVFVGIVYPGASPEQVEREVVDPIEDAHLRHQRARPAHLDVERRLRADHRAVRLRQADRSRRRRTCATPSPPCARSCRRRSSSRSSSASIRRSMPIVSLALTSVTLTPAQLTQIADPDDRRRAALDPRRRAGQRRGRRSSATLNVVLDPRGCRPPGVERRPGGGRRCRRRTSPRRWAGRRAARPSAPSGSRAASSGPRTSRSSSSPSAAARRSGSARSPTWRPAPRSRAPRRCSTAARRSGSTS